MKIPKEHKLIKNEVYVIKEDEYNIWIGKFISDNNESDIEYLRSNFSFLRLNEKKLFTENILCFYTNKNVLRRYRLATFKERKWLECCIENDRYIPEKEFNIMFRKDKIKKLLNN